MRSVGSVMVQRAARFGAEKSLGLEEVWNVLFAVHDRVFIYLSAQDLQQ